MLWIRPCLSNFRRKELLSGNGNWKCAIYYHWGVIGVLEIMHADWLVSPTRSYVARSPNDGSHGAHCRYT